MFQKTQYLTIIVLVAGKETVYLFGAIRLGICAVIFSSVGKLHIMWTKKPAYVTSLTFVALRKLSSQLFKCCTDIFPQDELY